MWPVALLQGLIFAFNLLIVPSPNGSVQYVCTVAAHMVPGTSLLNRQLFYR